MSHLKTYLYLRPCVRHYATVSPIYKHTRQIQFWTTYAHICMQLYKFVTLTEIVYRWNNTNIGFYCVYMLFCVTKVYYNITLPYKPYKHAYIIIIYEGTWQRYTRNIAVSPFHIYNNTLKGDWRISLNILYSNYRCCFRLHNFVGIICCPTL